MMKFSPNAGPPTSPIDETHYHNRRAFFKRLGLGAVAAAGMFTMGKYLRMAAAAPDASIALRPGIDLTRHPNIAGLYPAVRNPKFVLPANAQITDATVAATYNNFYEFTTDKGRVWQLAQTFEPDPQPPADPWTIEIIGECRNPGKFDIDRIHMLPGVRLEERTYRFRCVEAWAMDVPWTGFELNQLLKQVDPTADAKFVRFTSMAQPDQMPGVKNQPWYPWPYVEALRIDEAMNPLTLMVTGIYSRPLPRQHGAPFRVIVPWKYGYKNPKSIVKIELLREQPLTFWGSLAADEYPFLSNVEPHVPHPRWSQATERVIGIGNRRETLPYNGYAQYVAHMYS